MNIRKSKTIENWDKINVCEIKTVEKWDKTECRPLSHVKSIEKWDVLLIWLTPGYPLREGLRPGKPVLFI